ncbi:hypothetical protein COB55_02225 [Candidatus Wolfebacteria bacterium]|nr:MAG: hypothetical protein COB55_02225 [Candidatus Wolfebacteria bacterium]
MKILIVGAGPTGLTAALEFARRGIIPEIVDAKKSPSELSRAVGILPKSIDTLRASGVADKIIEEGVGLERLVIHYNHKVLLDLDALKFFEPRDLPIGLPQDRTETIMSDALGKMGVKIKYDCKVIDISTNQKEASVTFSNNESKKYDWVIGSDGVNSTVRDKLGIKYAGYELPEIWSIADLELGSEYNSGTFNGWLTGGAEKDIFVMVPIGPKRVRLVSSTSDSVKSLPAKLDIVNTKRVGAFKISIRQAKTYLKGRVLLAGDSAHTHSPVGGRGMNLGIDDAVEVVKAILDEKTHEYNTKRRKIGAKTIRNTERARKAITSTNPIVAIFIRLILFLVQHIPYVQKMFLMKMTRL